MITRSFNPFLALLALAGAVLLSACGGGGGGSSGDDSVPNASSLTSVTISGTVDEASTVSVDKLADSDPKPNAFSVVVPVSESATGADLALLVTATDWDGNSSSQAIDLVIVK